MNSWFTAIIYFKLSQQRVPTSYIIVPNINCWSKILKMLQQHLTFDHRKKKINIIYYNKLNKKTIFVLSLLLHSQLINFLSKFFFFNSSTHCSFYKKKKKSLPLKVSNKNLIPSNNKFKNFFNQLNGDPLKIALKFDNKFG